MSKGRLFALVILLWTGAVFAGGLTTEQVQKFKEVPAITIPAPAEGEEKEEFVPVREETKEVVPDVKVPEQKDPIEIGIPKKEEKPGFWGSIWDFFTGGK